MKVDTRFLRTAFMVTVPQTGPDCHERLKTHANESELLFQFRIAHRTIECELRYRTGNGVSGPALSNPMVA